MNAYFTRFMFENPQVVRAEHRASFFKGVDVYNIHKIPRGEFLEIALKASRKPPPTGVDLP